MRNNEMAGIHGLAAVLVADQAVHPPRAVLGPGPLYPDLTRLDRQEGAGYVDGSWRAHAIDSRLCCLLCWRVVHTSWRVGAEAA